MKERLLLFLLFVTPVFALAQQRYELVSVDGRRDTSFRAELTGGLFSPKQWLRTDQGRKRLSEYREIYNPFARFDVVRIGKRRHGLVRVLEAGSLTLYDVASHDRSRERYYRKIRTGRRLAYRLSGDSMLRILRTGDFERVMDSAFFYSQADHLITRRRYSWLNTTSIMTELAAGSVELAAALQSVAMLAVCGGVIIGGTLYLSFSRQKTFDRVRDLVAAWNRRAANDAGYQ